MKNVKINSILYLFIFVLFSSCKMNLQKVKNEEIKFEIDTTIKDKVYEEIVFDALNFDLYNIDFDRAI